MTASPLRLDGIVRVSKTGEREYLRSPDQQESDLRQWAAERGHELVTVHRAIDESAGKGAYPAIELAKQRALDGVTDGVLVAYLSRYSRNTLYGLQTVGTLLDAGRSFFAIDCPFDLRTKEGRKYLTNQLAEAEYEWRVRRDNFARGVSEAIERGTHLGVPFGYRRSNGKGSALAVEPDEAALVRAVYEWRAQGWSWQRIADAANARGPMPRPKRWKRGTEPVQSQWTSKTARGLLYGDESKLRRVYLGVALNGEHETPNAHPAIVDSVLFERATRAKGTKPVGPDDGHFLSGMVRCSGCGYVMTYNGAEYLRCRSAQHGDGRCPAPVGVNATQLEEYARQAFNTLMTDMRLSAEVADDANTQAQASVREVETRIDALIAQAQRLTNPAPAIQARFDAQIETLTRDLADAQAEEARTRTLSARPDIPEDFSLLNVPIPEQRRRLSQVFAFIIVRRPVSYREKVVSRSRIVGVNEPPRDNAGRIAFARAIRW